MRKVITVALLVAGLFVTLAACSPRTQLALEEERMNGAHFATWNHMGYSLWRGTPQETTKQDIALSQNDQCLPNQTCKWWGEVVKVEPIQ